MPPAVREALIANQLAIRSDLISAIKTTERFLVALGYQVETPIRTREERYIMGRDEVGENDG